MTYRIHHAKRPDGSVFVLSGVLDSEHAERHPDDSFRIRRLGGGDRTWLAQERESVTAASLLGFLRRELAPTPGRGSATFRLTLACVIATIPILTHRIPHALIVMIVMYLITQEDTAATLVGSILSVAGVTLGLGTALLVWIAAIDIAWLRIACFIGFVFLGLFLKRVLVVGALGSAIGLPAALVMILPDVAPIPPESLVEFVLWIWLCVTLGLTVNLGVQLLLAPGDPLTLLRREVDTRLRRVEDTLRELAGAKDVTPAPLATSLDALAIAGMSRPLALLKTASLTNAQARQQHETLATAITLVDRLVTDAGALRLLGSSTSSAPMRESLVRVAEACARVRQAVAERRWRQAADAAPRPSTRARPCRRRWLTWSARSSSSRRSSAWSPGRRRRKRAGRTSCCPMPPRIPSTCSSPPRAPWRR